MQQPPNGSPEPVDYILLVEDDPAHYELINQSIMDSQADRNIETVHVADGEAAIEYLGRADIEFPKFILLDLKLPKISGHEVLAWVKKNPRLQGIPVVILSTSLSDSDLKCSIELHANSILTKAIDFRAFNKMLADTANYWLRWDRAG